MSENIKILAFAGSTREQSYNKKLVKVAAKGAEEAGAEVTFVDLRDYPMPLFDEDLEKAQGMDPNAGLLKRLFIEHDGFLISSPEYNSSISAVLKNAIDWTTRAEEQGEPPLSAYKGKVATIMSASPGGLGGLRGLVHLRSILANISVIVLPNQLAVSKAYEAFGEDGMLSDERQQERVLGLGRELATTIQRLKG